MGKDIKISVIVPVYNVEQYLEECLNSLLSQTMPFYEIILINDGSTDGSQSICENYMYHYNNILLINQKNKGLGAVRNIGISIASGNYIVFVDSDDMVSESMNEKLIGVLSYNDLDVLYFSASVLDEIGINCDAKRYLRKNKICNQVMNGLDYLFASYFDNYIVSSCCATYKLDFIKKYNILFPEGVFYEDNPFYADVVLNAKGIECISDMLYIRRFRDGSITTSELNIKKCKDMIEVQKKVWDSFKNSGISFENNGFFSSYLINSAVSTFDMVYSRSNDLIRNNISFISTFIDTWYEYLVSNNLSWNDLFEFMKLRKGWIESKSTDSYVDMCFDNVKSLFLDKLIYILNTLSLPSGVNVAIYGVGNHTRVLIELYNRLIGKINYEYYFIVTEKQTSLFMGKEVVTCNEIKDNTDYIIVSSLIYQKEMIENLENIGIDNSRIVKLYSEYDKYDLCQVKALLQYE